MKIVRWFCRPVLWCNLRVISWIGSLLTVGDPLSHTKNHEKTTHAIDWVRYQKSLTPDKPFYMYFAPGATHAPHHVPKEWIAKYKGKFDQGWDNMREETLAHSGSPFIVTPLWGLLIHYDLLPAAHAVGYRSSAAPRLMCRL